MRKFLKFLVYFICFWLVISLFLIAINGNKNEVHGGDPIQTNPAINWDGTWTQTDESDAYTMVATIHDGVITININAPDQSALYWTGTWPASVTDTKQTITSVADRAALDASLLGSQDATKDFKYEHEVLSYKFTALGVTQTIHMEHDLNA